MLRRTILMTALVALGGCAAATPAVESAPASVDEARVRSLLTALAHDSMQGRRAGTAGAAQAARLIAEQMQKIGLTPAGDSAFHQWVHAARVEVNGRRRNVVMPSATALDTIPAADRLYDANLVGMIAGSDPALRDEAVVVGAHFDHIGIIAPVNGDSIANGADDDASGVVAVLEIARALRAGPAPKRTVIFVAFAGEEGGGIGSRKYLADPVVPLTQTVAQLQIEMIGRPDSLAGGPGRTWLTGYERSTMGAMLADAGIAIVQDPRPDQRFFMRSDNYAFARAGIPAHTLSSFNLHTDYHRVSDEVEFIDVAHMTVVIGEAIRAVRILTDGPKPEWLPGMKPE